MLLCTHVDMVVQDDLKEIDGSVLKARESIKYVKRLTDEEKAGS